jgi:hypothetical protein
LVYSHSGSQYPWEEDHWGDIPWTVAGEHAASTGSEPLTATEDEVFAGLEQMLAADPQNPQSQEEFEASPEYHQLLVSYTNSLTQAIPGASVQWNADTGKIQYIDFSGTYEETTAALEKAGYFTGVTNYAFNPIGHPGGKEFRDPLSVQCELSFHFAILYPQYKMVGGRI